MAEQAKKLKHLHESKILFDHEMRRFMVNSPDNFDTGPD